MFFNRKKTCSIPQQWILAVAEKLKRGSDKEIEWTATAMQRWNLHGYCWEAQDAMLEVLVPGLIGKFVKMPIDEGPTYAFFFIAKGKKMYGKICLTYDGRIIIIHSAHTPERDEL